MPRIFTSVFLLCNTITPIGIIKLEPKTWIKTKKPVCEGLEAGRKLGIEPTITAQEMSAEDANPIAVMTQVAKYQQYRPPANHNSSEKARQQQQQQQQPVSNGLVEEEPLVKVRSASGSFLGSFSSPPPTLFKENKLNIKEYI